MSVSKLKKILLAEDSPHDIELTLAALQEPLLADEIFVVRDGAEALDYLHRRGAFGQRPLGLPVVAVLDLKMPKIDGFDVLREIRSDPELRSIPVVMLTSSREESDLLRSYELGANAYVVKPVDFDRFLEAVRRLGSFWALTNEPPPRGAAMTLREVPTEPVA